MTATEARQTAMKAVSAQIDAIELKIKQACKKGRRDVGLRMPGLKWWESKLPSSAAIMFFEEQGYRYCSRNNTLFW